MTNAKEQKLSDKNEFWRKLGIENPDLHTIRSDEGRYSKTEDELAEEYKADLAGDLRILSRWKSELVEVQKAEIERAIDGDPAAIASICTESVLLGTI